MQAMSPWVFIYFILIVVLGGFFVINLFLAVIFEETISAQLNEEMLGAAVRLAGRFNDEAEAVEKTGGPGSDAPSSTAASFAPTSPA